jgi:hypothetical protein
MGLPCPAGFPMEFRRRLGPLHLGLSRWYKLVTPPRLYRPPTESNAAATPRASRWVRTIRGAIEAR